MTMEFKIILGILLITIGPPVIVYFCVKFGTIAYYNGKEVIRNKHNNKDVDVDNVENEDP